MKRVNVYLIVTFVCLNKIQTFTFTRYTKYRAHMEKVKKKCANVSVDENFSSGKFIQLYVHNYTNTNLWKSKHETTYYFRVVIYNILYICHLVLYIYITSHATMYNEFSNFCYTFSFVVSSLVTSRVAESCEHRNDVIHKQLSPKSFFFIFLLFNSCSLCTFSIAMYIKHLMSFRQTCTLYIM